MNYHKGMHWLARITTAATFILINAGGLVKGTGSSLAVPDWPLAYGYLFPPMIGGIRFEQTHRYIAGTVACLMVWLAIWVARSEERPWVRKLAWAALGAVFLQAVLGGLTVLLLLPPAVSILHATVGQTFFCLVLSLALVTSKGWLEAPPVRVPAGGRDLRLPALAATCVIYVQLILGALIRHFYAGLAIPDFPLVFGGVLPPAWTFPIFINYIHRVWALVVASGVVWVFYRAARWHRGLPYLYRPALLLGLLVTAQLVLGACVIWTGRDLFVTTAHVANAALTLGTSLFLTLRAHRVLGRADDPQK